MLVLAADCKSVPEKASCSIQHTPTKLAVDFIVTNAYIEYTREETKMNMKIHSGDLSYLNRVHKQYGIFKYWMRVLNVWSDGKMTVEFVRREDEK